MAEPLAVLLRLHEQAVEDERRLLHAASEQWAAAVAAASAARRDIATETARAEQGGDDALAEAFAAWLPVAMATLAAAERREADAQAEIVRQRASLAAARAAARAAEIVLQAQAAGRLAGAARQVQAELDDAGLRRHRPAAADRRQPD